GRCGSPDASGVVQARRHQGVPGRIEGDGRDLVRVPDHDRELRPGRGIPNPSRAVVARGGDLRAVAAPDGNRDISQGAEELSDQVEVRRAPDPQRPAVVRREKETAVRAEHNCTYKAVVLE